MYACLHISGASTPHVLLAIALEFSPAIEQTCENTVVFSVAPLRKLVGSPHQIVSEICHSGHEKEIQANLAIAANVDTAILLARHFPGVTLVTPGEEKFKLAPIPLTSLFMYEAAFDPKLLQTFHRWGLKTCEDLAALPEAGLVERLGPVSIYLRKLASGEIDRPLRLSAPATNYEERMELEHPLHLLEPLLFLLGRVLSELCGRLRSQSQAARSLVVHFDLESSTAERKHYRCELEFPVALDESQILLKLLQLHLERHPPEAAVTAFTLQLEPAEPRRVQGGFFLPPVPAPDKLQITLARIAGLVGKENVGTPVLLNTHRPDAFEISPGHVPAAAAQPHTEETPQEMLRLAMRVFRPALLARVTLAGAAPKNISAQGVKGSVIRSAGPWKTSGEWWTTTSWIREEWDVALDDGALYRIYQEMQTHAWYVHGVYD